MNLIPVKSETAAATWQAELGQAVSDPDELLSLLALSRRDLVAAGLVLDPTAAFPLRVPRPFVAQMRPGDPHDPLLRQVLPLQAELEHSAGLSTDPLAEAEATQSPGLIQKYHGRVLLIAAPACAVHCRYCFRRHFPYADHQASQRFPQLANIKADPSLREVILSGGDPLMLKDGPLAALISRLDEIDHLTRLRIHTRLPVVIPSRITAALAQSLAQTRLTKTVVLHLNHPQELSAALREGIAALRSAGVWVLNQSVLLRGVNDRVETLQALSEMLFDAGVLPYYLHLPDAVQGTAHFQVSAVEGLRLWQQLGDLLPGYLLPKLVRETPGLGAKQVLGATENVRPD